MDFEMHLANTQPACLVQSLEGSSLALDPNTKIIALYDNKEVSSQNAQGAGLMLMGHILHCLSAELL